MKILLALLKKVRQILISIYYWNRFRVTTPIYFQYDNITLRLYVDIAKNGTFEKLVKTGTIDREECLEVWEKIVKDNGLANGSFQFITYRNLFRTYSVLYADYIVVEATLAKLSLVPDALSIEYLKSKGYRIDTSSHSAYVESFNNAKGRAQNLITKMRLKQKEMDALIEGSNEGGKDATFEEVMAALTAGIGFEIKEDVTLARANEYRKIIKQRNNVRNKKGAYNK